MSARHPDRDGWMHLEVLGLFLGACVFVIGCALIVTWAWVKATGRDLAPAPAGIIGLRAGADHTAFEGWV